MRSPMPTTRARRCRYRARRAAHSGTIGRVTREPRPTDVPAWARWLAGFFKAMGNVLWALAIGFAVLALVQGAWWAALVALAVIAGRVGMWRLRERNRIEVEQWQQRGERGLYG